MLWKGIPHPSLASSTLPCISLVRFCFSKEEEGGEEIRSQLPSRGETLVVCLAQEVSPIRSLPEPDAPYLPRQERCSKGRKVVEEVMSLLFAM